MTLSVYGSGCVRIITGAYECSNFSNMHIPKPHNKWYDTSNMLILITNSVTKKKNLHCMEKNTRMQEYANKCT